MLFVLISRTVHVRVTPVFLLPGARRARGNQWGIVLYSALRPSQTNNPLLAQISLFKRGIRVKGM